MSNSLRSLVLKKLYIWSSSNSNLVSYLTMRKIQFLAKSILKHQIMLKKLLKENLTADQTHV